MGVLGLGAFCYIIVEIRQLQKVITTIVVLKIRPEFKLKKISLAFQERKQKALERRLNEPATDEQKRIDDETDDEKDELEEDIVVTHL